MTERIRTSLARTPSSWTDDQRAASAEAARRRLWLEMGVATLDVAGITDAWVRQVVVNLAEARYGKRGGG